jgi:hypothetical protein
MWGACMIDCTDIFWHRFYKGAGVMLGAVLPLLLGFGVMMWAIFRQQHRHEEAMQVDRLRADQVRRSRYRVIQGGQGDGRGGGGPRVLEILGRPGGDLGRRRVHLGDG